MTTHTPPLPLAADPYYLPLKEFVIERTGMTYYDERESDLMVKLKTRLDAHRMSGCEPYLRLLAHETNGRTEFDALIVELTIGETYFFRHREMFDAIRDIILPNVFERNRSRRRIRVWSAGCSIGAEAYSMSILIRESLGERASDWDVAIVGTDINRHYLAKAEQGEFDDSALCSLPDDVRQRYFEPHAGKWRILPTYRETVRFQYHNLVTSPTPSLMQNLAAFDIILCRNVMIYFSDPLNRRLVANFHDSLAPEGWLVVGHSEPQGDLFDSFRRLLADGAVLYQKPDATTHSRRDATPRR